VALTERLRRSTGVVVEVVALEDAASRPSLMVEIVRDGRVLIDRDGRWAHLRAQKDCIAVRAERDRQLLAERARDAASAFASADAGSI
jgi:hypothetical protein